MIFEPGTIAVVTLSATVSGGFWSDSKRRVDTSLAAALQIERELALPGPTTVIASGTFQDARIYGASRPDQPEGTSEKGIVPSIIGVYFIQPWNETSGSALVIIRAELDTCYLRDARIDWNPKPPQWENDIPSPFRANKPLAHLKVPFVVTESPVRLSFRGSEVLHSSGRSLSAAMVDRARVLGEAYAAARSNQLAFPLRSELLAKACQFFSKGGRQEKKLRIHRDLVSTFYPLKNKLAVSEIAGGNPVCTLRSAPFSHRVDGVFEPSLPALNPSEGADLPSGAKGNSQTSTFLPFSPTHCLSALLLERERVQNKKGMVQVLENTEFEVISRNGRHVALNAGRTAGLTVGSRLIGPSGERLHVIRLLLSTNKKLISWM